SPKTAISTLIAVVPHREIVPFWYFDFPIQSIFSGILAIVHIVNKWCLTCNIHIFKFTHGERMLANGFFMIHRIWRIHTVFFTAKFYRNLFDFLTINNELTMIINNMITRQTNDTLDITDRWLWRIAEYRHITAFRMAGINNLGVYNRQFYPIVKLIDQNKVTRFQGRYH